LPVILGEGPHCLSELAEKQAVSLPTTSHSIGKLVERGWVTRSRAHRDWRIVEVELTPAGRAALGTELVECEEV
jgi:DNA-binding MarR family transcriptional regulator